MRATASFALLIILAVPAGRVMAAHELGPNDVRGDDLSTSQLGEEKLRSLIFDKATKFSATDRPVAESIMEQGKDPGLGVRALHRQGINGAGVSVAIIDQNLARDLAHPEFKGKIAEYHDAGCKTPAKAGSMHGPAVTSLLVGADIGTAPGAKVYYVAAPSWTGDAGFYGKALEWIVAKNRSLPAGRKIRVVSVSAAPSGAGSPFEKNNSRWDKARQRAEQEGILVLDCTQERGITSRALLPAAARDGQDRLESAEFQRDSRIGVPVNRTVAEEYSDGRYSYTYYGKGGLSWTIPYVAGVLAMGWQVRPELSGPQMLTLLFDSAHTKDGVPFVDPPAFIELVRSPKAAAAGAFVRRQGHPELIEEAAPGQRLEDKVDLPFADDPAVLGTWTSVDYVNEPGQFSLGRKASGEDLFLKSLVFMPGGKMEGGSNTWTKGLVLNSQEKTASRYEIRKMGGRDYMFYEWKSGDYTLRHMKPAYYVLERAESH